MDDCSDETHTPNLQPDDQRTLRFALPLRWRLAAPQAGGLVQGRTYSVGVKSTEKVASLIRAYELFNERRIDDLLA